MRSVRRSSSFRPVPIAPVSPNQFLAALAVVLPLSLTLETRPVVWSGEFIFALAWLVLVLSLGAITLLLLLIRRGAATAVSSLMYLVPAITVIMAWLIFDETLTPLAIAGMVVAVVGVALVVRPTNENRSTQNSER